MSTVDTTNVDTTGSVTNGASSSHAWVTYPLSSGTSLSAYSTPLLSSGNPTTIIGNDTTITAITNFQSWMEEASLNLMDSGGLNIILSLWSYTTRSSAGFLPSDVTLILYILGNITKNAELSGLRFSVDTVEKVLVIVDHLNSVLSLEPADSTEKTVGPQLLRCLESLFSLMSVTYQPVTLFFKYSDFHCSVSSCEDLEENGHMHLDSNSLLSLPENNNKFPSECYVNVLSMTYKPPNKIFNSQFDRDGETLNSFYLASTIQTHVMILNNRSYHTANIHMSFTCGNYSCDQTAVCVFWDFNLDKWSSNGCVTQITNGSTTCICSHLTSFSILMSNSVPEGTLDSVILDYITQIGLSFSILALVFCIAMQIILLRLTHNRMASHRYWTILHISVFLLISNISFIASSLIDPVVQGKLCVAFTFCTHLSLMGYFCWTLVQSVFLVCRLVFVFHHITMRQFIVLSVMLGYICPLAIAVSTFLKFFPDNYRRENACWLKGPSGASLAFTIPTIVIVVANFLVLIVVIRKLLRPSISEGNEEDEEVVKKLAKAVVFYTPQYGLTWAVGVPLLTNQNAIWLHYMFDILNPLQGIFLLLFGCLLDKKGDGPVICPESLPGGEAHEEEGGGVIPGQEGKRKPETPEPRVAVSPVQGERPCV
ncbi:adhesion G-protein coupled receptor F1-like [Mantella aurantiaca]